MFTVCSKCNLRLTVTATDLRAAQGYVRCGRCHNVFNALAALADDPVRQAEAAAAAAAAETHTGLTPPSPPEPPPSEPATPEAEEDLASTDTSLEFNPASTNINEVFIEAVPGERTGTFESIILVSEEPPAAEVPIPSSEPGIAPQALSAPLATPPERTVTVDLAGMRDALAEPQRARAADSVASAEVLIEDFVPAVPVAPAIIEPLAAIEPTAASVELITATEPAATESTPSETSDAAQEAIESVAAPVQVAEVKAEPPAEAAPVAEPESAPATEPETAAATESAVDTDAAREIAAALSALPEEEATPAQPIPEAPPVELLATAPPPARLPRWAWQGVVAALALILLVQVVHHYRGPLAESSMLRRPITGLYQALGAPIEPRWDISRYEIRQLGATSDGAAAGDLVVRASISNRADRVQPLPLLRVVMQDRFGNRVAARDLTPAEYLGRGAPQVSLIAPGQRVDLQVAVRDPGQAATGFEIDACMSRHDHTVTCANDPGNH